MKTPPTKPELRAEIRAELKKISPTERAAAAQQIRARLEEQEIWRRAGSILFFAPLPDEPDLWPLLLDSLAAGKLVALPRFMPEENRYAACQIQEVPRDIQTGRFGIREPRESCAVIPLNRLDLALVTGVAFDLDGNRLGRGAGYYDRLLAVFQGTTCGVAFDQQMVGQAPVEPHDVRLNYIVTPTRWHGVAGPRAAWK